MKLPFIVAEADSGSMGGSRSHEFHFATPIGEDQVVSCSECSYVANEEKAESYRPNSQDEYKQQGNTRVALGVTKDRNQLIVVKYLSRPKNGANACTEGLDSLNVTRLRTILPDVDPSVQAPLEAWKKSTADPKRKGKSIVQIQELKCGGKPMSKDEIMSYARLEEHPGEILRQAEERRSSSALDIHECLDSNTTQIDTDETLSRVEEGELCPRCKEGRLHFQRGVELGHTFHLGTRYSEPLGVVVRESESSQTREPVSMGCHGIGISRMIGAVASVLTDDRGLNWPAAIAPYEAVVIASSNLISDMRVAQLELVHTGIANENVDAVVDDRDRTLIEKLKDADLIGFPVIVVLGKQWAQWRHYEIQCRRLGVKTHVPHEALTSTVKGLIDQL